MTNLQSIETWNNGTRTVEVACLACGQMIRRGQPGVADLDGPAYRAYYHVACAPSPAPTEREEHSDHG